MTANNILVKIKYLPTLLNEGVWNIEPDILLWTHNSISCLIVRSSYCYTLNGYVQVDLTQDYFYTPHGGITYTGACPTSNKEVLMFVDKESSWIGFDAGHHQDYIPVQPAIEGEYRTISYIKKEVELLAGSIKQ